MTYATRMTNTFPSRSTQYTTNWWRPAAGLTWQWQIGNNNIDTSIEADVYDIHLYVDESIIDKLHVKGRKVIGYINVGSWETGALIKIISRLK